MPDSPDQAAWDAYVAAVRSLWGGDTELMRLVVEYGEACNSFAVRAATTGEVNRAEAAIREHVARYYVRRDDPRYRILDRANERVIGYAAARGILPWKPGDELPEERIRRLRDAADSNEENAGVP